MDRGHCGGAQTLRLVDPAARLHLLGLDEHQHQRHLRKARLAVATSITIDSERSDLQIDQSSLSLPRSVLVAVDDANNAALVAAYRNYAENVALAITQSLGQDVPLDAIQADVNATLAFEVQLAQVFPSGSSQVGRPSTFHLPPNLT